MHFRVDRRAMGLVDIELIRVRLMLSINLRSFRDKFAAEYGDDRGLSLLAKARRYLNVAVAVTSVPEYEIRRGTTTVATLIDSGRMNVFPKHASIIIDGKTFELSAKLNDHYLRIDNEVVASATKRTFRRVYDVVWGFREYEFRRPSLLSAKFVLLKGNQEVGSITWEGDPVPGSNGTISLPDDIDVEVQLLLTWLVMLAMEAKGGLGGGGGNGDG